MTKNKFSSLILFCFFLSCTAGENHDISVQEHQEQVDAWHESQMEFLQSDQGWLNLIGLIWLENGVNTFGAEMEELSLDANVFPEKIGSFILENDKVYFDPLVEGVELENIAIDSKKLVFDINAGIDKRQNFKNLQWNIIKRGDSFGVRLRDLLAKDVVEFAGVDRFPVDLKWRIKAKFIPYNPIKEVMITNVVGQVSPNASSGYVEFDFEGKTYKIDALANPDDVELFLMFADDTSGESTYGGGRYMYVDRDFESDEILLDFNMAYNPPCVYTAHATCPLPPKQNVLDLAIMAGHKNFGKH
ncbi:DUF1684 domain-containing protein [Indibacter alkaliphilus]|nr:DUF1684 domain-containing protein [Indibacter alkaliphilus]